MMIATTDTAGDLVGIDVGKYAHEVHRLGSRRTRRFGADELEELLAGLPPPGLLRAVILEATGGYERPLVQRLRSAGYAVHVAHPVRVRAYATAQGQLAKSDPLDAAQLSAYGAAMWPLETTQCSASVERLRALKRRRDQLLDERKSEHNRLDKTPDAVAAESIRRHLDWLDREIEALDKALDACVAGEAQLTARAALMQSIKGVGRLSALTLMAELPELGQLRGAQLVALAGLAPYARDSSTLTRQRYICGGRARVRQVLYMAAVSAAQHNPSLSAFYQRLRRRGKPAKLALVAVMRKLLLLVNAVIRRQTPWTPEIAT